MDSRIESLVEYTEGPTVLDFGAVQHDHSNAQNGDWLHKHLAANFDDVIGVDILKEDVAELNKQGYTMIHADVTEMEIETAADTVVMGELIEHVANPGLMLETANDHLKPSGKVVLSTPNPWGLVHIRRLLTGQFRVNEEHVAWYGPKTLEQLLNRYGFAIEQLHTTDRDHNGFTGIAQTLGSQVFGGTTWIVSARKQ